MKPATRAALAGVLGALLLVAALFWFAGRAPLDNALDGDAAYPEGVEP